MTVLLRECNARSDLDVLSHSQSSPSPGAATRHNRQKLYALQCSLGLLCGFFAVELGVGLWIHSLALLADAGHMLLDVVALGIALISAWLSRRSTVVKGRRLELPSNDFNRCSICPNPDGDGYVRSIADLKSSSSIKSSILYRVEPIAALVNSLSLVILTGWVAWEAILRLQSAEPAEIFSIPMMLTAVIGLGVNGCNVLLLHDFSQDDLNLRAAFLHVLADAVSSIGVIIAAIAIYQWGWAWTDSIMSLLIAGLVMTASLPLIVQSLQTLCRKPAYARPIDKPGLPLGVPCDCDRNHLEKLLFPSLEDHV